MSQIVQTLYVALFVLALIAVQSCSPEDAEKSQTNTYPPFDDFWFATNFDLPSVNAQAYTKMTYYNVWAEEHGKGPQQYRYYLSNTSTANPTGTGVPPPPATLSISTVNSIITIKATGTMPREGTVEPTTNKELWDVMSCSYSIEVVASTLDKTVSKAVIKVESDKFAAEYDVKSVMKFTEVNKDGQPEWSISATSDSGALTVPDVTGQQTIYLRLSFRIDDVYGTSIKK